jgi:hypothetical protein|nr:MAG TPA: hypothetical protein [Caudoviricetes sp.]
MASVTHPAGPLIAPIIVGAIADNISGTTIDKIVIPAFFNTSTKSPPDKAVVKAVITAGPID